MYHCGIFTLPPIGTGKTIYGIPFTPVKARYTVHKTTSASWLSAGRADSAGQEANTTHFDAVPSGETLSSDAKCILHRERQSGVLVTILDASHHSFGTNKARFNVYASNPDIQIFGEFWS